MKKAQLGQVFIFILAAALAILIIVYGYKAISSFTSRTEDIALVNLKTTLQSEVRTIASDYGSVKKVDISLPGKYDMLCLIDLQYPDNLKQNKCLCRADCAGVYANDYNPTVCDAWETPGYEYNAFLVSGNSFESIELTDINIIEPATNQNLGYICIAPSGNRISLRLEGAGDSTNVYEWQ